MADAITLQGDIYNANVERRDHNEGHNVLTQWDHHFANGSALEIKAYFDKTPTARRGVEYPVETSDIAGQYVATLGAQQSVVGERPSPAVPAYVEADARLGWNPTDGFTLSLVGPNLLHDHHPEGATTGARNQIRRGVYLNALWRM